MSKKKKTRKKPQTPPLSFLDQCIYGVGFLLVIITFVFVFWFYCGFPHRFALQDGFVIAADERLTTLWFFPLWFYLVISLLGIVAIPCTMKKPIFGNSEITYGPPHWENIYPLFGKQKNKRKPSSKERKGTAVLFFGWLTIFFIFFFLSFFSLFGRNTLMQNGDITVYSVFNQEKRNYSVMDISTLEIQTGSYSTGKGFSTYWRTEYEFTMNDGRSYEFTDSCFRSDRDAFENMIKMKTLVDRQKITIEGVENLDKVIDDNHYTPEELELLYELFAISSK
jgi:hypothetical protein